MDDLYPAHSIAAGLAALARRWPDARSESGEEPVFVLAAGWRSGSTLLQRALLSHCFVWGEPFGHAGLLERMADPLRTVNKGWPEPHFMYRGGAARPPPRQIHRQPLSLAAAFAECLSRLVRGALCRAGAGRGKGAMGNQGSPPLG